MHRILSIALTILVCISTGFFSVTHASDTFKPLAWKTYSNDSNRAFNEPYEAYTFTNDDCNNDQLDKSECEKILRPMVRAYEEQKNIKEAAKKIGISLAKSEGISSSNVTTSGIRLKNGTDCYFFFMQLDEENTAMGSCLRKNKTTNQYTLAIIAESTSKDTFLRAAKTLQGGLKSNKGLSPKMQQSYNNLVQLPKALESAEKFFTKTKNQSK